MVDPRKRKAAPQEVLREKPILGVGPPKARGSQQAKLKSKNS
jgi:hypothetical protein